MKLQAEVTGGGEGAEFALKRLAPVLVLMYLEKEGGFKVSNPFSRQVLRDIKRSDRILYFSSMYKGGAATTRTVGF